MGKEDDNVDVVDDVVVDVDCGAGNVESNPSVE